MPENIRLSKLMTLRGICSRREADVFIKQGQVLVDGEPITVLGTKVSPDVKISLQDSAQQKQDRKVTILLHKPVGFVSNLPEDGYEDAITLITRENQHRDRKQPKFFPDHVHNLSVAGRLDIDSKGLLVFTQNGTVAKTLIAPNTNIEKEYLVRFTGDLNQNAIELLQEGLFLDGKPLKKAKVKLVKENLIQITLKEGKKRQIRRMLELVNLKAVALKRIRIGRIHLGNLKEGTWRYLEKGETF